MTHLAVGGCCQKTVNDMKHVIITGIKAFINVKYLLVLAIHVGLVKNTQHLLKTVVNLTTQMRYLDNDTVVSKAVDKWINEYGVRYFSELTNMAVLTEEVGEMAKIIARRYGEQSWKKDDPRAADNGKKALGDEMADVLWVLLCLANQTGVDLTEELRKNIEKKTLRDKDRHVNNEKLKLE